MTKSHKSTILPIKNRVLAADEHTALLAHMDLGPQDVLKGIEPIGESEAALFDTTYIKAIGPQYEITTSLTMTAWVYPTAVPSGDRGALIIGKGPSGGYYLTIDTSYRLAAYWHGKTPAGYHTSVGSCPLNQWSHVAVVWSAIDLKLYINGILDTTIATSGAGVIVPALDIGAENVTNRYFKGKVNHLGIWAETKSAEEIKQIMNKGMRDKQKNLRGFWKMNEGGGNLLRDSSPFHGDLTNEPNKTFSWGRGSQSFTMKPQEGRFGGAIAIEEETTNLYAGPLNSGLYMDNAYDGEYGFGINTNSKWVIDNSDRVFDSVDVQKIYRIDSGVSQRLYVHWTGLISRGGAVIFAAGEERTVSFYYYGTYGKRINPYISATGGIVLYADSAISGNGTSSIALPVEENKWQRVTFQIKNNDATQSSFSWGWLILHSDTEVVTLDNTHFWNFTGIQVERKSFATSFVNGTRPTGSLIYPHPLYNSNEGTINFWVKFPDTRSILTSQVWFWDYDGTVVTEWFGISNSGGVYKLNNFGNLDASTYQDAWHMYTIVKNSENTLRTYIDGAFVGTKTGSSVTNMFKSNTSISIGSHSNGAYPANILMDELRIDKIARTDEEITAWYESNSPFWPRGIYRQSY